MLAQQTRQVPVLQRISSEIFAYPASSAPPVIGYTLMLGHALSIGCLYR